MVGEGFGGGITFEEFSAATNWGMIGALAGAGLDLALDPEALFFKQPSFLKFFGDNLTDQFKNLNSVKGMFNKVTSILGTVLNFVNVVVEEDLSKGDIIALVIALTAFVVLGLVVSAFIGGAGLTTAAGVAVTLVVGAVLSQTQKIFLSLFKTPAGA